jgi:subtilisin family serine protease
MTGTSFATPTVTGLCALLLGVFPDLRSFELKTILKALSDQTPDTT